MSVLLVEDETCVVDFLTQHVESHGVGVVSLLEIVLHQQLFVLEVAVLGLYRVQLVTEGEVVLVTLLNFENLGLELRDQQVLLVTSEMHAIVILQTRQVRAGIVG